MSVIINDVNSNVSAALRTNGTSYSINERTLYQDKIDAEFEHATDVYTIQQETFFASGSFTDLVVRINHVKLGDAGEKIDEDYRKLIFSDINYSGSLGLKYYFDENYWLCINTSRYKKLTPSVIVRRCNNVLRWVDDNGAVITEPCILPYKIQNPQDYVKTNNLVIPEGNLEIYCQQNPKTRTVKENQRFLFGNTDNWTAYKVYGTGIRNFMNTKTLDNNSATFMVIYASGNFENNEDDNNVLGIADYYKKIITMTLNPSGSISGDIGGSLQIVPSLYRNGVQITEAVTYATGNASIATVSGSGVISFVSAGSCVVTACMTNNLTVSGSIMAVVSSGSNVSEVRISPSTLSLIEGDTKTYSVYLYLNGVQQADTFTFALANNLVPDAYFTLTTIDGNSFSVKNNKRYATYPLTISCVAGSYSKNFDIQLRGIW